MASKYIEKPLTDVAAVTTGKTNRQDAVENGKYPLFDRSQETKRSNRYLFDAAAVIVPGEGQEFIPRFFEGKFDLHQRAYAVIPNKGVNPRFIYYAILWRRAHFARVAVGSTVKSLRLASFESMSIPLPELETQNRIAHILNTIDDAITNNLAACTLLADMLDSQFERLVNIESGEWKIASLLDIANYKNGLAMQRFRPVGDDPGLPVLKIRELGQGYCGNDAERCRSDIDEAVTIHDGDLVFSWSGTLLLDFWAGGDAGLNQHLFKVTSEASPSWFYYEWTKRHMRRFISLAKDRATTMGHIKRSALKDSEVLIPSETEMIDLTEQMQPFVDEMIGLKVQSRKLGELRNALLPKLMSGEIDVSQIELPAQPLNHLSI